MLAVAVDLALRDARRRTYGTDLWDTAPLWPNQLDTEFTKDRAELRVKDGGLGARETSERALFLNTMCNIAPAIAGTTDQQSLWPTLRDKAFGPDLLKTDTGGGGWSHFFATGCAPARELASEIDRVKRLHQEAHENSGRGQDPTDPILSAPTNIFGLGVEKLHHKLFDIIRTLRAEHYHRRSRALPSDDNRAMASIQSSGDLFAGALITAPPDRENRFTNLEFQSAFQNLFGCPQEVCRPHVGKSILTSG